MFIENKQNFIFHIFMDIIKRKEYTKSYSGVLLYKSTKPIKSNKRPNIKNKLIMFLYDIRNIKF